MRHYFLKLLLSALALLKPKRKLTWKRVVGQLIWMTVLFVVFTTAMVYQYEKGREDERQLWEPKWQMERDVYRTMPFRNDD